LSLAALGTNDVVVKRAIYLPHCKTQKSEFSSGHPAFHRVDLPIFLPSRLRYLSSDRQLEA